MKSMELQPTKDNLLSTLSEDILGRNTSISYFLSFLNSFDTNQSICIDAPWGSGKTFFVKQTKMALEMYNPNVSAYSDTEKSIIECALKKARTHQEEMKPQVCVYYDAWANDNDTDPLISIVYEIMRSIASDYTFASDSAFLKKLLKVASSIVELFSGVKVESFLSALKGNDDPLKKLKEEKSFSEMVNEFFEVIIQEKGNRLVVFIDELDRCKPSYAVQLLERIKHYFAHNNVTFIFSINGKELQHTIKRYYGNDFDACRYLERFFDYNIPLPPANYSRYYEQIGINDENHLFERMCTVIAATYNFELREVEKFYRTVKSAAYAPTHGEIQNVFLWDAALQFCFVVFLPTMVALRMTDSARYESFIQGKDVSPVVEIINKDSLLWELGRWLLDNREVYTSSQKDFVKIKELTLERLSEAYHAVFLHDEKTEQQSVIIGKCQFRQSFKNTLLQTISLFSKYATY